MLCAQLETNPAPLIKRVQVPQTSLSQATTWKFSREKA